VAWSLTIETNQVDPRDVPDAWSRWIRRQAIDLERPLEFWRWWLQKALPQAWKLAEEKLLNRTSLIRIQRIESMTPLLEPFAEIPVPPNIAALPKADIHIHQEWSPRLDRVLARQEGREPYNWREWATNLMKTAPPGAARLRHISSHFPASLGADANPRNFVARVVNMLEEAAADGAVLVETRFGRDMVERPDCLTLFREAERQVQARYPRLRTAAIPFVHLEWETEKVARMLQTCIEWAGDGLIYGVDLFNHPYDTEADWSAAYRIAEQLAAAGLGITVHVAEVAPVNVAAVLRMPGLKRLGHATHAGYHPQLLEMVARSGVTIECSLTCNVVFGATPSYEEHPVRRFVAAGIPVALCTDDPVQICTTIGREYAIAGTLGFSTNELLGFTRNAMHAAFISSQLRTELLTELDAWNHAHQPAV
jgi:adenosine deaminase